MIDSHNPIFNSFTYQQVFSMSSSIGDSSSSRQKSCIQCGNKLKPVHLLLKDKTYIDSQCLEQIKVIINNLTVDQEDMLMYYQYVLGLVMNCNKCNAVIDGTTRKNHSGNTNYPICNICQPNHNSGLKNNQKCQLCNHQIDQVNLLEEPIKIGGLTICQRCYDQQCKGFGQRKQKEEKPDFGSLARKPIPFKKQEEKQQSKAVRNNFICGLKKEVEKLKMPLLGSFSKKEEKQEVYPNDLFKFVPEEPQLNKSLQIKPKKELYECGECMQKMQFYEFQLRKEGYNICKECYKNIHVVALKKQEKKQVKKEYKPVEGSKSANETSFGLDTLFDQTPESVEFQIPFLEVLQPQKQSLPLIDPATLRDSYMYDLKGCKICFNAQSSMINTKCRHLMMCEQCFRLLQSRHKGQGDVLPCPYCATIGKYNKYIEPLYI